MSPAGDRRPSPVYACLWRVALVARGDSRQRISGYRVDLGSKAAVGIFTAWEAQPSEALVPRAVPLVEAEPQVGQVAAVPEPQVGQVVQVVQVVQAAAVLLPSRLPAPPLYLRLATTHILLFRRGEFPACFRAKFVKDPEP